MIVGEIEPISLFGTSGVSYIPQIRPIGHIIKAETIGKEERIQKKKSIEEGMNQMAKGFAEGVFSYDKSFNAVNPYYCSFDEES